MISLFLKRTEYFVFTFINLEYWKSLVRRYVLPNIIDLLFANIYNNSYIKLLVTQNYIYFEHNFLKSYIFKHKTHSYSDIWEFEIDLISVWKWGRSTLWKYLKNTSSISVSLINTIHIRSLHSRFETYYSPHSRNLSLRMFPLAISF